MRKSPSALSAERQPFDGAVGAADIGPKGSINLRIDASTRRLIDDAAAALGKNRTEFMIESARAAAIDALLDQRMFLLEPDHFDTFVAALDAPPMPTPKLKALLTRSPSWRA